MSNIIEQLIKKYPESEKEIRKAFSILQNLSSKGLDLEHNLLVSEILANIELDKNVVIAGLLHNVLDYGYSEEELKKQFNEEIVKIIIQRKKFKISANIKSSDIEKTKRLVVALTKDIRLILLEISDRLGILKNFDKYDEDLRERVIKEISQIYLPISNKLGIWRITSQMQDLLFKQTNPEKYKEIQNKIIEREKEQKEFVESIRKKLESEIKKNNIPIEIKYRTKTAYSTYNKMTRKNKKFEELYDICALRVITDTTENCYKILGIVNTLGETIASEFDDYIAKPKDNGYQAIHVVLKGKNKDGIELQIKTKEMDNVAEFGIAAHWRYKAIPEASYDERFSWLREIIEWKKESPENKDSMFGTNTIFVFTPKRDVIELPAGSTVLDFAYAIHTELGNKCSKARVNGKIVPLEYVLDNADVVEIITSPNEKPKSHWLNIVKTDKAKQKIRSFLHIKEKITKDESKKNILKNIDIEDKKIKLAKCCNPLPGDDIIAFATTKRKISVHIKDCPEAKKMIKEKNIVNVRWGKESKNYVSEISVIAEDRIGLLKDILNVFSNSKINVESIDAKTKKGKAYCYFTISVKGLNQLIDAIKKIYEVRGVLNVKRGSL
ncbi:MAG: HD domain-containing protein [Candidatus Diapherotrites archaeon]|nr:HD domain-containing protein [Candidatus Diapherotrites archaeon]